MPGEITLTIDGQPVTVPEGSTILEAARSIGLQIPTICYHEACSSNGRCRMCVTEVEGGRVLAASCVAQAAEGMKVHTQSERVERSRRTILSCWPPPSSSVMPRRSAPCCKLTRWMAAASRGASGAMCR